MTGQRKPMTFNVNAPDTRAEGTERQQVGARVTKATLSPAQGARRSYGRDGSGFG